MKKQKPTAVISASDYHASIDEMAELPPADPSAIFTNGDSLQVEEITLASFDRLSQKQKDVLGQISINNDGGHHPRTVESLLKLGLIVEGEQEIGTRLGKMKIKRYSMPLHVHVVWCAWCELHWKDGLTPEEIAELEGMDA